MTADAKTPVPLLQEPGVFHRFCPQVSKRRREWQLSDSSGIVCPLQTLRTTAIAFISEACPVLDYPHGLASWAALSHLARWNHLLSQKLPGPSIEAPGTDFILVRPPPCVIPPTVKPKVQFRSIHGAFIAAGALIGRFGAKWVARTAIPTVRVRSIPTAMKMRAAVSAFDVTAW